MRWARGFRKRLEKPFLVPLPLDFPFLAPEFGQKTTVSSLVRESAPGVQVRIQTGCHLRVVLQCVEQGVLPLLDHQSVLITLGEEVLQGGLLGLHGEVDFLRLAVHLFHVVHRIDLFLRLLGSRARQDLGVQGSHSSVDAIRLKLTVCQNQDLALVLRLSSVFRKDCLSMMNAWICPSFKSRMS